MNSVSYSKTKHVEIGGVRYEITVVPYTEHMYRATWFCLVCDEEGAWAPVSLEVAQAIESATVGVEVHHSFCHGPGSVARMPR